MTLSTAHSRIENKKENRSRIWNILILVTAAAILVSLGMLFFQLKTPSEQADHHSLTSDTFDCLGLQWTVDDTVFSGRLDCSTDGMVGVTLEKPEELSGLQLKYDFRSEQATAEYRGMEVTLPTEKINSVLGIGKTLRHLFSDAPLSLQENGVLTEITGTAGEISYRLILDGNGNPQQLSIPAYHLAFDFFDDV